MSDGHYRAECQHGVVVAQCRCPAPSKRLEIVRPCPMTTAHLGLTVVHPLPPATAVGTGLGQVAQDPAVPAQEPLGAPEGAPGPEEGLALYLEAIKRYARDEAFHARVKAIEALIVAAEYGTPSQDSRVGMWIGAAVALHLAEEGRA